jgi:hypothetical protein
LSKSRKPCGSPDYNSSVCWALLVSGSGLFSCHWHSLNWELGIDIAPAIALHEQDAQNIPIKLTIKSKKACFSHIPVPIMPFSSSGTYLTPHHPTVRGVPCMAVGATEYWIIYNTYIWHQDSNSKLSPTQSVRWVTRYTYLASAVRTTSCRYLAWPSPVELFLLLVSLVSVCGLRMQPHPESTTS